MSDIVETIINKVSELEGLEPLDLEKPLYEVIDPECLESITEHDSVTVTFNYLGYRISVTDEEVQVSPIQILN